MKITFSQEIIETLENLTDVNEHCEARLLIAKTLKNQNLVKTFKAIAELHNLKGYMCDSLTNLRFEASQKLKEDLEIKCTNAKQVWAAL